jgi:hypothetical protein
VGENRGLHKLPIDAHIRPPDGMKDTNIVGAIVDLGLWAHPETMHRFVGAENMSAVSVARHRVIINVDHNPELMVYTAKVLIGMFGMIQTNDTTDAKLGFRIIAEKGKSAAARIMNPIGVDARHPFHLQEHYLRLDGLELLVTMNPIWV